ncbi:ATP-binding protein [uncultured Methanobrevibacter sp.]|uniref:ATP-binding protein n=1 Tax=uncultured Methanobrevibacter sp. TaxID=253161 RepID=UPI00261566F3|nr:AAA family ATPase [uncultured Methanobrevibacter sp.]
MGSKEDYLKYIVKQIQTTPYVANEFLQTQNTEFKPRNSFEDLQKYVDDFLNGYEENRFITMPGLRGIGKSTMVFQIYNHLIERGIDKNRILYVPIDQMNSIPKANLNELIDVFVEDIHHKYPASLDKELFLLVDEAQEEKNWSKIGKIIYDQSKKIFMIFTGSKALDFELDLNAVRRTSIERIYPMNFQEYLFLKYHIPPIGISTDIMDMLLTGNVENVVKKETDLLNYTSSIGKPLIKEFEHFLYVGGFPLSLNQDEINAHRKIFEVVERVIDKDVSQYRAFNGDTNKILFNILSFLATQKPGEVSVNKLSKNLATSRSNVIDLLDILEKTHLIFHIKPYGEAGKTVRKPSKYYFLSPSITASINFNLGKHTPASKDYRGILAETLVASTFFRLNNTISKPNGIFYPPEKGMADFIITTFEGDKIPVEVGIGKKSPKHVINTMNKYNCEYGIVVSQTTDLIKKDNDIIFLPLTTFSLM